MFSLQRFCAGLPFLSRSRACRTIAPACILWTDAIARTAGSLERAFALVIRLGLSPPPASSSSSSSSSTPLLRISRRRRFATDSFVRASTSSLPRRASSTCLRTTRGRYVSNRLQRCSRTSLITCRATYPHALSSRPLPTDDPLKRREAVSLSGMRPQTAWTWLSHSPSNHSLLAVDRGVWRPLTGVSNPAICTETWQSQERYTTSMPTSWKKKVHDNRHIADRQEESGEKEEKGNTCTLPRAFLSQKEFLPSSWIILRNSRPSAGWESRDGGVSRRGRGLLVSRRWGTVQFPSPSTQFRRWRTKFSPTQPSSPIAPPSASRHTSPKTHTHTHTQTYTTQTMPPVPPTKRSWPSPLARYPYILRSTCSAAAKRKSQKNHLIYQRTYNFPKFPPSPPSHLSPADNGPSLPPVAPAIKLRSISADSESKPTPQL